MNEEKLKKTEEELNMFLKKMNSPEMKQEAHLTNRDVESIKLDIKVINEDIRDVYRVFIVFGLVDVIFFIFIILIVVALAVQLF